jgi:homoaconitase/3-isopropylmalate dehydratase large subunit
VAFYVDYCSGYEVAPIGTADAESVSSWTWPSIPDQVSNNVKIKITDADNEAYTFDESAAVFHIVGSFTFTSPDGSPLTSGTSSPITWTTNGTAVTKVKVEFYDGSGWSTLNASYDNSGNYPWTVPSTTSSPNCKARITAQTPDQPSSAKESSVFWIHGSISVTAPTIASKWTVGTLQDITFTITGNIDNVNISCSNTGAEPYSYSVAANVPVVSGPNTYQWTLPTDQDILSATLAKLKIEDAAYTTVYGVSANFMIKGAIAVLTPDANDIVLTYGGVPYTITWSKTGPIQNVRIYYSINDGVTYPYELTDAAGVPSVPASYPMDIPNHIIGKHLKVKVADKDNLTDAFGVSSNTFEIIGQLAVVAPNGGEKWTVGSTKQIQWTPTGTFTNARIEASINDFTSTFLDVTQPAGASGVQQSYDWIVTNNVSNNVKIRVSDPDHHPELAKDVSDAAFRIFGGISVSNPVTGQVWFKGQTTKDVTWDATASITNVKIEYKTTAGGGYSTIVADSAGHTIGANSYTWTAGVADENSETCYIRVSDVNNYDDSYGVSQVFAIRPVVTVSEPVAGFNIRVGSTYASGVKWSLNGSTKVSLVDVKYSTVGSGGPFNQTIASGVDATLGTCNWNVVSDTMSNNVVVQIIDTLNANTYGLSNAFQIVGKVTVQQPNGANDWAVGAIDKNITWTKQGTIGNAYIYVDYGSGYDPTPLATVDTGAVSSWNWNPIPDHVSNSVKIKITDADNEAVTYDESDAVFHIIGTFTISQPDGAPLISGDPYEITWTTLGAAVNNVKIEFFDGSDWSTIAASAPNSGSYLWTVPITTSSPNCKIRITAATPDQPATQKESVSFWVHGKVTVTEPVSTDKWIVGELKDIVFNITGKIDNVNITYSKDGGSNYTYTIVSNLAVAQGANTYQWTVPTNQDILSKDQAKIKVADAAYATVYGASENFMIKGTLTLLTPTLDNIIMTYGGVPYSITWSKTGPILNVRIYYSTNDGVTYPNEITTAAGVPVAPPTYAWDVPNQVIGKHLKVKIVDKDNDDCYMESGNSFTIIGSVALNAPNGGEKWTVGSTRQIRWTPTGTFTSVRLEASINDFTSTFLDVTQPAGATGVQQSYDWVIPNNVSNTVKIRVSDPDHNPELVTDTSDAVFKIFGAITVTNPKTGQVWYKGQTTKEITWDATASITNVTIEYKTTAGGSYTVIAANDAGHTIGPNTYIWSAGVADENSETAYIRVSDANNYDDSYGVSEVFAMRPVITVSEPVTGANIRVGASYPNGVKWSLNGSTKVSSVDVLYSTNGSNGPFDKTITTGRDATLGQCDWNVVTDNISNNVVAKVMDSLNNNTFGLSNVFNIAGTLTIQIPNGGNNWPVNTTDKNITWTKTGTIGNANIYVDYGSGYEVTPIATVDTSSVSSWNWNPIPDHVSNSVKIKIADADNEAVTNDESDATFNIIASFIVNTPANGSSLTVDSSYDITWDRYGSAVTEVKIEYSSNGGTNYTVITNNATNSGTYPWAVPDAITTSGKVRISDPANVNAVAVSGGFFKIHGSLTVASPNNGTESWDVGSTYPVTWTKHGSIALINIYYSHNNGTDWTKINPVAVDAALGTWDWTISDAILLTTGFSGYIRVEDASDATVYDLSNAKFEVKGAVTLNTPTAAGITLKVGDIYNITWAKFGAVANVELHYSINGGIAGGGSYLPGNLIATVPATDLSYNWSVADAIGTNLRIRIRDAGNSTVWDESGNAFSIIGKVALNAPLGGETWFVGDTRQVRWTPTGTYSQVKLEYSTNAFSDELEVFSIATVSAGASGVLQSYDWTVPDKIGNNLKVRVTDASNAAVVAVCGSTFTIKGSLALTSPTGGLTWIVGESRSITWNLTGTIPTVKLEYTKDGLVYNDIIASTPGGTGSGSYSWTVADAIGATTKVRLSDTRDANVNSSCADFTIKGSLTLTSPNGGEVWGVDDVQDITWTKMGSIVNVKLEYSTNGFSNESETTVINNSIDATGVPPASYKYSWTIPDAISTTLKVRISNTLDATVQDISNNFFKIRGAFVLTAPNGGEKWGVGIQNNVTWTRTGSILNAKIEYSTNGGLSYPGTVIASTPAGGLTYAWTVPDAISTTCKVKISDVNDATVEDASNANFIIMGAFNVTAPNGGEVWVVNENHDITWGTTGTVANVKLEYSTDGGLTYPNVIVGSTTNNNLYSWTIPDSISNTVRVQVSDASNADAADTSNANFKIKGSLTLTAPNGSEVWSINTHNNITWSRVGSVANVKLDYSTNAFANELETYTIIASTSGATLTYDWLLPDTPSSNVKVRITDVSDATVYDVSNAVFRVVGSLTVTSPNGAEQWVVDATNNITWTKFGAISNVKLMYSTDAGATYPVGNTIIATTPAGAFSYSWTIPDSITNQARVKIFDVGDESVTDQSDANFIIKGSVTLTSPNGGENWIVGENRDITWTKTGSFSNVKLEYSTNAFSDELLVTVITASTPAAAGTYSWTVADAIGTNLKVRVSDAANASVNDVSNAAFTIKGAVSLSIPNGGETWIVGESRNITWTRTGSIANVKLEYSTDGGATYPTVIIASTPAGALSYGWTVADAIGGDLRVRISDALDATVNDASNASFTIKGSLSLTVPNGGESWVVDTSYDITWTRVGSIANVKLEYSTNAFVDELQTTVINNSTDATGTPAGSYKYGWTVPDAIGNTVKIRISNTADSLVQDVSNGTFRITGAVLLTAPNGGQNWVVGSSQSVTWQRTGTIANVKLEYSTDGGATYPNIVINSTPAGGLNYAWTIPDSITTLVRVRISDVSDAGVNDSSDANFAIMGGFIISAPNGGEVWVVNDSQNIAWATNGTVNNVKLEYSTDGGATYPNLVIASTPNNNIYAWTIPDAISIAVKVRVSDALNANSFDISNGNFKIKGALHVDSPNTGTEQWSVGYSYPVLWTRTGAVQNINIYYSANAGVDWIKINGAAVDASLGTWDWSLPGDTELSTQARVQITDTSDPTVTDMSNNNFVVKGGLRVETPNAAGVSIQVGNSYNITWTKFGNIPNVQLHYSTNGGIVGGGTYPDPGNLIAVVAAADQLFVWDIPDRIGTNLRIRVRQDDNVNVWDESDNSFEIKGNLQVVTPNGGEVWFVGDSNDIQWIPTG